MFELSKADRRPEIIHPIVKPQHRDIIMRRPSGQSLDGVTRHSVPAHLPDATEHDRVSCKDDAALGGR